MDNPPQNPQSPTTPGAGAPAGSGRMPSMDGDDTLRLLSSDGSFAQVPLPRAPGSQPPVPWPARAAPEPAPAWGDLKGSSFARLPVVTVMSEQRFPLAFTVALPIVLAAVLGITYLLQETLLGGDWSSGALALGIAALIMALGTLATWGVRYVRGRKARSTLALALALAVTLAGGGAVALAEVTPLHTLQGQYYEQQHNWGAAIDEFALAGADSPGATNIARIYVEWGEQLMAQRNYPQAVIRFKVVLTSYAQSGTAVLAQANRDLFLAYSAWVNLGGANLPYPDAIATISAYSASAACDATCKAGAGAALAEAHYQYGLALASVHRYADAIAQFQTVQKQYASSPLAAKAHAAAARAYLTYGKQLLTASCPLALPLYRTLASSYADTPQGKQASAALAAPVTVTGALKAGFPTNPPPTMYLSSQIDPTSVSYSDDYKGTLNTTTGVFTFTGVAPGSYYVNSYRAAGSTLEYNYWADNGNPFAVGPLCTANLGNNFPY